MPLLLINDETIFDKTPKEQKKHLLEYAKAFKGKVQVVVPKDRDEWATTLKTYKPRNESKKYPYTVVLLGGVDYFYPDKEETDIGYYRLADLIISDKGGVVIGDKPSFDSVSYYKAKNPKDAADYATYLHKWAHKHNYLASRNFLGRGDSDVQCILFGFCLDFPKISMGGLNILGGLSTYNDFWKNCAWMKVRTNVNERRKIQEVAEEIYPDAARIAITENAHRVLDELGLDHVFLEGRPGKAKTAKDRREYGSRIFEAFGEYNERQFDNEEDL